MTTRDLTLMVIVLTVGACGGGRADHPGSGGAGAGSTGGGGAGGAGDPAETATWSWNRCGTIPATAPFDGPLSFIPDGRVLAQNREGPPLLYPTELRPRPVPLAVTGKDLAFSADGTEVVESTGAALAVRWVDKGTLVREVALTADDAAACSRPVALSASGSHLLARGPNGHCVYDLGTGRMTARPPITFGSAAFLGDSTDVVATVQTGNTITLAHLDVNGTELGRVAIASDSVYRLSPDGATALSMSAYSVDLQECTLWSTRDGTRLWSALVPPRTPLDLPFSPRGDLVAACGAVIRTADGVRVHDIPAEPRSDVPAHTWRSLSPDGRFLLGHEGASGAARLDLETGRAYRVGGQTAGGPFDSVAISHLGGVLITNGGNDLLAWYLTTPFEDSQAIWIDAVSPGNYPRLDLSGQGDTVTACGDGCWEYAVRSGGRAAGPATTSPAGPSNDICWPELRLSPDGRWTAGVEWDPFVRIREFSVGRTPRVELPVGCLRVAFSPDSHLLATTRGSVYRVEDGQLMVAGGDGTPGTLGASRPGWSDSVVFSPDQSQFLISIDCLDDTQSNPWAMSRNGLPPICTRAELHATSDGRRLKSLPNIGRYPSFSPDGSWLVADDLLLHLSTDTTRTLDPGIRASTFTPDGKIIAGDSAGNLNLYCRR